MKITSKQLEEIEFLEVHFVKQTTSLEEREEYIRHTVQGGKNLDGKFSDNPLMKAKVALDRTIKMWREDLRGKATDNIPTLFFSELWDEYGTTRYGQNLINSLRPAVTLENLVDLAEHYNLKSASGRIKT